MIPNKIMNMVREKNIWPKIIHNSALFDGSSQYLTYTPSTAGDRKTWTWSAWIKRTTSGFQTLFSARQDADNQTYWGFSVSDGFFFNSLTGGATDCNIQTADIFVDQTSWYHITLTVDTTDATAADRIKLYVNGVRVTDFSVETQFALNTDTWVHNTVEHGYNYIGSGQSGCYIASSETLDGQALPAETFGEFSHRVTGLWVPKNPVSLTYGTNGYRLDFSNAADLGEDASGNGNDWTVNGSPVPTFDTPINNCAIWNAAWPGATLSNGNLSKTTNLSTATLAPKSGKFAWKTTNVVAGLTHGLLNLDGTNPTPASGSHYLTISTGSTYEWFWDVDAGVFSYKVDGGALTEIGTGLYAPLLIYSTSNETTQFADFVPSEAGYTTLCSANLPEPTILKSAEVADIVLREGTSPDAASIDSLLFAPDFVNIKSRDNSRNWKLFDAERGVNNSISTNLTSVESTETDALNSFNSDGYSLGSYGITNSLGESFIDLCLKVGVDQGFEIVTYTGDGQAGRTVAHNLGKVPTFMVVKRLDSTGNWYTYHTALGAEYTTFLDLGDATYSNSSYWNNTEPTASEFTVGISAGVNAAGGTYVAYLFTDSDIFKAFSYTGNGSTDGPFVELGGKLLSVPFFKNSDISSAWDNVDAVRNPFNGIDLILLPNDSGAEFNLGSDLMHFASTGFKLRNSAPAYNGSGNLIVGLAILESTKYSNAF